jgi:hypothetical protein
MPRGKIDAQHRTFEELIRANVFAWLAGLLVTGFLSGIASYEFLVKASGQTRISASKLEKMHNDGKMAAGQIKTLTAKLDGSVALDKASEDKKQRLKDIRKRKRTLRFACLATLFPSIEVLEDRQRARSTYE